MDNRNEVRQFLVSRRARITPQQAGLPDVGARRVPGLRRVEVAALAGVSVEYYAKLERGALGGVSASVLDSLLDQHARPLSPRDQGPLSSRTGVHRGHRGPRRVREGCGS